MTNTYTTRRQAVELEIVQAIQASGEVVDAYEAYDVEAIADVVLGDFSQGYAVQVDVEVFWDVVAAFEAAPTN